MRRFSAAFILGLAFTATAFTATASAQSFTVPALRGPVEDTAGILSTQQKAELTQVIADAQSRGHAQVQVLTVPTLGDVPIENATLQVVEAWKLGTQKKDNGVLFLIASNDKKMRIEVGQGLEGDLPDVIAKRILADVVAPFFRAGKMGAGIQAGVDQILKATDPVYRESAGATPAVPSGERTGGLFDNMSSVFFLILFVIASILRGFGGRGRRSRMWGAGAYGALGGLGGFGGGRGGGGGWSGGGGGFSGGGASSGW